MRVLLLSPSTFGYEARLREAFERIGCEVVWLDERVANDAVTKIATRLGVLRALPKVIKAHVTKVIKRARQFDAERIIVINPETLRGAEFQSIKSSLPNIPLVIYRWDSLAQKPVDDAAFEAADAVYSFDPSDCNRDQRLRHLPLFHNHSAKPNPFDPSNARFSASFVGTSQMRRVRVLGKLCRNMDAAGQSYFFFLKTQSPVHQVIFSIAAKFFGYRGVLTGQAMPYEEMLELVAQSGAVIDIEFGRQSGLTMRTIEVAFSGQPLLTTNKSVEIYDFFRERPVCVFDENNPAIPDASAYDGRFSTAFFGKYHIENWARMLVAMNVDTYFADSDSANSHA